MCWSRMRWPHGAFAGGAQSTWTEGYGAWHTPLLLPVVNTLQVGNRDRHRSPSQSFIYNGTLVLSVPCKCEQIMKVAKHPQTWKHTFSQKKCHRILKDTICTSSALSDIWNSFTVSYLGLKNISCRWNKGQRGWNLLKPVLCSRVDTWFRLLSLGHCFSHVTTKPVSVHTCAISGLECNHGLM